VINMVTVPCALVPSGTRPVAFVPVLFSPDLLT